MRLSQARVPPRSYVETIQIRDKAQAQMLSKRRSTSKATYYVANKQQGEIRSLNVAPLPTPKHPCVPYERRVAIYNMLSNLPDEQREDYFHHRAKVFNISSATMRVIWSEGQRDSFTHHIVESPRFPMKL